jgi:hypothetical protein
VRCATHGPDPSRVTRSVVRSLRGKGEGGTEYIRARATRKERGTTQKKPRVRVKLTFLFPSASLGLPAASVPAASAPAASVSAAAALPLATGGMVDAEADPRFAPPRLFAPIRRTGKKKICGAARAVLPKLSRGIKFPF